MKLSDDSKVYSAPEQLYYDDNQLAVTFLRSLVANCYVCQEY